MRSISSGQVLLDGTLEVPRLETPGTQTAVVEDTTVLIEEVESRGQCGKGLADLVVDVIDVGRVSVTKAGLAAIRHLTPFFDGLGIFDIEGSTRSPDHRSRREIPAEPPAVLGVSLSNVDADELDVVSEALKNLAETPGPGSVGRSSKAAENERHWPAAQRRQPHPAITIGGR